MAKDARITPSALYEGLSGLLDFHIRSYESGQAYRSGDYIWQHSRETDEDFKKRKERAAPPGYARGVINTYKSLISRGEVTRNTRDKQLQEFLNNCDRRGTSFDTFMIERVFPIEQAAGYTWVLVDMPREDDNIITKADEIEQRVFPYVTHYPPNEVVNWLYDGFGNLQFVTIRLDPELDPETGKVKRKETFKVWTTTEWILFDHRGKRIEGADHNLGIVPMVVVYNERSSINENLGQSAIANIAWLNRTIYNLVSLLDDFLYRQCFNVLAVPESLATQAKDGEVAIGTANAIPVPQGEITPAYVSPPVAPAEFLLKSIDANIDQIHEEAGFGDRSARQTTQAQSGISRAFQFHNTNTRLVKKAKNLEDGERDIVGMWGKWMSRPVEYEVGYPQNFDIRDATAELDEIAKVIALRVQSPTLKRSRIVQGIDVIRPDMPEDQKKIAIQEIEQSTFAAGGGNGSAPTGSIFEQISGGGT